MSRSKIVNETTFCPFDFASPPPRNRHGCYADLPFIFVSHSVSFGACVMSSLPVVADCEGCGVCCLHMGYPPYLHDSPGHPDVEHWQSVPESLKVELEQFIAGYRKPSAAELDGICCWFDPETRKCRHYAIRPQVCRDFKVGCPDCLGWRRELLERDATSDSL